MFKQSIVLLIACIGSLLLTSNATTPTYDIVAKKYHIPPHVLKGVLKVEGHGLTTKWNNGSPHHHAYGPGQMTCYMYKFRK